MRTKLLSNLHFKCFASFCIVARKLMYEDNIPTFDSFTIG